MGNNLPLMMEFEPGTYYWCGCGKSRMGLLCDGSHRGTPSVPIEFVVDGNKKMAVCACGRTKSAPVCDGTHARID